MKELVIYSDGACSGNPGPGGWGCVVLVLDKETEKTLEERSYSGGEKLTTNNRMELMGAITGLKKVSGDSELKDCEISFFTDSQYVKNGISSWIQSWKKNGWKTAAKKAVKNQDLWMELDSLNEQLKINWCWVKGHAGNKYNEICDSLAVQAGQKAAKE